MFADFIEIFKEPVGLPTSRGREHFIVLEHDARPVSVRPFRYRKRRSTKR